MKKIKLRLINLLVACIFMLVSILPVYTANAAIDLSASALSDTQIKLQWSWVMGAVKCKIFRDGATSALKVVDINSDSEYTSFTDSGLMPETQYSYRIEMENDKGNVVERGEVSVKTLGISRPVIISSVFDIASAGDGLHNITIKWKNGASRVSGAVIERLDGTEIAVLKNLSEYTSGDIVTYTFKDTITEYNQPLQYTVTVTDEQGRKSQPSSPVIVTPLQAPVITAVMNNGSAVISWPKGIAVENFQLERSQYGTTAWGDWEIINATIPSGTFSIKDTLVASGSYRYRLTAIAGSKYIGTGNISDPVQKLVAPSNVVCTFAGTDKMNLTWTNDANNKGVIKIEKRTEQGSFIEIATLARNISSYTDTDHFLSNQTYYYKVIAYDTDENKAESSIASVTLSEPKAPSDLEVTVESNKRLVLTWEDKSNNETSFTIERKTGTGEFIKIGTTTANTALYSDTGISTGESYTYRVYSSNTFGDSKGYSNEVTVKAAAYTAPSLLTLTAVSTSQIDLSWKNSIEEPLKTIIERKMPGDTNWKVIAEVPGNLKNYSDTQLQENTQYGYRIRALLGENVYSVYADNHFGINIYTKLATPDGLSASITDITEIVLSWNDKSSESNFIIQRKEGSSGSFFVMASVPANTKTWTDHEVTAGRNYSYRIQARTNNNESDYSEVLTITATRISPPSSLALDDENSSGAELSWKDNSDNESGFEIWRKTGADGVWEKYATVSANVTSYTDRNAKAGTQNYYKVRAYISNSSAVSGFSNEVVKFVKLLEAPLDLIAEALSDSQIKLVWEDKYSAGTEFSIERKEAGGSYKEIAHNVTAVAKYIDNDLMPNTKYYYRVRAFERDLYSDYSSEVTATTKAKVVFSDLGSVTWAKSAIENMASRGILNGTGAGKFSPLNTITRAQFVCILIRSFGLGDYASSAGFSDVTYDKWYYSELMAAKALSIISPDSSNNFYPEEAITREDMAVFMSKTLAVAGKPLERVDTDILDSFNDKDSISDYALQSVADLYKAEIMVGRGGGMLSPKSTATRAEAAVIISRIIDR